MKYTIEEQMENGKRRNTEMQSREKWGNPQFLCTKAKRQATKMRTDFH
jgi:hypothetical protein